ncbi:tetraspanin-9-like [Clytia hemisphaerica]|uniref:Tetraspanin n=1 Tax=Clytia hemisphaerica TaxID=252671 RepID=A0A7M5X202_9CNID
MANSRTVRCVKWLVFVFNLLFFLSGCCLIGFGVWLNVARDDWQGISEYAYMSIANICLATGIIIVLVAFVGCCGAITENKIMLLLFFIFLLVIFLMEIGSAISAYIWREKINEELKDQLEQRIPERYYTETAVELAVNKIQSHFKCCGLYNSSDWGKTTASTNEPMIDQSCCIQDSAHSNYNSNCVSRPWGSIQADDEKLLKEYYQDGCYDKIKDFIKENMWLSVLFGFIFAFIQIIGMVLSMFLYCVLRRNEMVY